MHCVKGVRIQSYSGPYFPAFRLNTERYSIFSPHAGKCGPEYGKMQTTFHVLMVGSLNSSFFASTKRAALRET